MWSLNPKSWNPELLVHECLEDTIENKIIYWFEYTSCTSCLIDDFNILNQLSDSIGEDNILFLSNFESDKVSLALKDSYSLRFEVSICNVDLRCNRDSILLLFYESDLYEINIENVLVNFIIMILSENYRLASILLSIS